MEPFGGRQPSVERQLLSKVGSRDLVCLFFHKCKINQGVMVGRRRCLVEDDVWWKMTSSGRRLLVEDDLQWKTAFSARRPLVVDKLQWKTTFDGRRPSVEDDLWWRMAFGGR